MTLRYHQTTGRNSKTGVRIGISACLLGQKVRYDGGDKRDGLITGILGRFLDFVPVCPEVAVGMGVPRAPIHLRGDPQQPRAVGVEGGDLDMTESLEVYAGRMAGELGPISGYIFKSRSPSCGMQRVPVHRDGQRSAKGGVGIYARGLMAKRPLLPVEDERRLNAPGRVENFIERVFAYKRWQELCARGLTEAALLEYHMVHDLTLRSRGMASHRDLNRMVDGLGAVPFARFAGDYIDGFMAVLKLSATRRRHAAVLTHLLGHLRKRLAEADRTELLGLINRYRRGVLPLIVPLTLLRHHFRRFPHPHITKQVYLTSPVQEWVLCGA